VKSHVFTQITALNYSNFNQSLLHFLILAAYTVTDLGGGGKKKLDKERREENARTEMENGMNATIRLVYVA